MVDHVSLFSPLLFSVNFNNNLHTVISKNPEIDSASDFSFEKNDLSRL